MACELFFLFQIVLSWIKEDGWVTCDQESGASVAFVGEERKEGPMIVCPIRSTYAIFNGGLSKNGPSTLRGAQLDPGSV